MPRSSLTAEGSRSHPGVLVLCEPDDVSALWAAAGLEERTGRTVDVVTAPMLTGARTWEHRIRGDVAEVEITLADGRRISSRRPRPVLNRLSIVPSHFLGAVEGSDRDYAVQELHALFLSWLWAHPGPMLNRPSPQFLGGHWRPAAGWAVLAARADLPTARYRLTSDDLLEDTPVSVPPGSGRAETVFVVAGQALAPSAVPSWLVEACQRLAALTGDDLVGVDVARVGGGSWEFVTASPIPNLYAGGERLVDVLAATLVGAA
jgi:hypothetical protein